MSRFWLLACTAVTGAAGMGFEMVASRYLTPWFGGGIEVWASLIATVMAGMAVGYVAGGRLADRMPTPALAASAMCAAAAWLGLVPVLAPHAISVAAAAMGDGGAGAIAAATLLAGPPMALLAMAPPVAIRLLTRDTRTSGGMAGLVYGVSTAGSIAGVLGTAFGLIPHVGINATTRIMAAMLAFTAAALAVTNGTTEPATRGKRERDAVRKRTTITRRTMLGIGVVGTAVAVGAAELIGPSREPAYPEGLSLDGGMLRMADIATGEVTVMDAGTLDVERTIGMGDAGPTAIAPYGNNRWLVACHRENRLAVIDDEGYAMGSVDRASDGGPIPTPNDCTPDGNGGAYVTSAGEFRRGAPWTGSILHVENGMANRMAGGLHYANGIAYDPQTRDLFYTEHFERRLWRARADGSEIRDATVIATFGPPATREGWTPFDGCGPDNLRLRRDGTIQVPMYGEGRVLVVTRDGKLVREVPVPCRFVTDTAELGDGSIIACGARTLSQSRGDGFVGVVQQVSRGSGGRSYGTPDQATAKRTGDVSR